MTQSPKFLSIRHTDKVCNKHSVAFRGVRTLVQQSQSDRVSAPEPHSWENQTREGSMTAEPLLHFVSEKSNEICPIVVLVPKEMVSERAIWNEAELASAVTTTSKSFCNTSGV